jgi:hypothetical protein
MKSDDRWVWLFAGVMVILPLIFVASSIEPYACSLKIVSDDIQGQKAANCFEFWLNRYQTLVGGFLTVIAGSFAYFAAQKQINHAESLEQRRRVAEEIAARARLSFALNEIYSYTEVCLKNFAEIFRRGGYTGLYGVRGKIVSPPPEFPIFPAEALDSMQNCIRYANQEKINQIAILMSNIQIVQARNNEMKMSYKITEIEELNIYSRVINAFELRFLADELYDYARMRDGDLRVSPFEYIEMELPKHGFSADVHPRLYKILKSRAEQNRLCNAIAV